MRIGIIRAFFAALFAVGCAAWAQPAEAQGIVFPTPIGAYPAVPVTVAPVATVPVTVGRPVLTAPFAPVTTYRAPITTYRAPITTYRAPITAYAPAIPSVTAVAPVAPVVTYRPPVVAYQPALTTPVTVAPVAVLPAVPVTYGRPVIVRPKFYVPGQPVRNFVRAVTP